MNWNVWFLRADTRAKKQSGNSDQGNHLQLDIELTVEALKSF
jgi:hypothetical protein